MKLNLEDLAWFKNVEGKMSEDSGHRGDVNENDVFQLSSEDLETLRTTGVYTKTFTVVREDSLDPVHTETQRMNPWADEKSRSTNEDVQDSDFKKRKDRMTPLAGTNSLIFTKIFKVKFLEFLFFLIP